MEAAIASAARAHAGCHSLETLLATPNLTADTLNKPSNLGNTALHISVWRNHLGQVLRLLAEGANPNVPDHESGWSAVHSALHWGNLQILAALLQKDGSLTLADWKARTPLDLASAVLKSHIGHGAGDVFSWGNGNNYTLGTGSTFMQLSPSRIESLHDAEIVKLSAAKFHSAAVSLDGRLFTWGWGRGGRLGHPEAHIHSGESAVIAPRIVSGLGKRQVLTAAAAKHHTVFCTTAGELYTMGSNRHGQLGYAVDTQPTPRRVGALRARVVTVAAANKHSVAVASNGDVYTWGCNVLGQLGYGTSDSMYNCNPRLVEAMKGKAVQQAAAAKRHTVVLTTDGEVYIWGHRGVSPRRVQLAGARDALSSSAEQLWFHRGHKDVFRPQAVAVCAGAAHTSVLTSAGVVLCWRSADPALVVQEVGSALGGKRIVSISAGKYRTAAVTDEGDMYMWEGRSDYFPAEGRQPGSGSKNADKGKGRAIPSTGFLGTYAVGTAANGSPSPADVGSYGSSNRKGSYFDRFAREKDGAPSSGMSASSKPELQRGGISGKDDFAVIVPERVEGMKRSVSVSVGEKHSLALQRWSAAQLPGLQRIPWLADALHAAPGPAADESLYSRTADSLLTTPRSEMGSDTSGHDSILNSPERSWSSPSRPVTRQNQQPATLGVPSLQRICEQEVARQLVDPRTALQVLEYADVAGADLLRAYCLSVAVCNLDSVLLEARGAFEELPQHLLVELERIWKLMLSGAQGPPSNRASSLESMRQSTISRSLSRELQQQDVQATEQPIREGQTSCPMEPILRVGSSMQPGTRPTAAAPCLGLHELDFEPIEDALHASPSTLLLQLSEGQSSFKDKSVADAEAAAQRLARALLKKLQQIDSLEHRAAEGAQLDSQQLAKVSQRPVIVSAMAALQGGMPAEEVHVILKAASSEREEKHEGKTVAGVSGRNVANSAEALKGKQGGSGLPRSAKRRAPGAKGKEVMPDAVSSETAETETCLGVAAGQGHSNDEAVPASVGACTPDQAARTACPSTTGGTIASLALSAAQLGLEDLGASPPSTIPAFGPLGHVAEKALKEPGEQFVGGFKGLDEPRLPRSAVSKSKEKTRRKGGLSMFLRGDLEKPPTPPPRPGPGSTQGAASTPPWGSKAQPAASTSSLKDIFNQEAAAAGTSSASKPSTPGVGGRVTPGSAPRARPAALQSPSAANPASAAGGLRMSLANFMTSSPLQIQRESADKTPAWGGASGTSPPASLRNFRQIQEEQEAVAASRSFGTSPSATQRPIHSASLPPWRPTSGVSVSSTSGQWSALPPVGASTSSMLGGSPTASSSILGSSPSGRTFHAAPKPQHSKWYVPEERSIKSLRSIQTEESAVKELAKRYGTGNVRIVPKEGRVPGLAPASTGHRR